MFTQDTQCSFLFRNELSNLGCKLPIIKFFVDCTKYDLLSSVNVFKTVKFSKIMTKLPEARGGAEGRRRGLDRLAQQKKHTPTNATRRTTAPADIPAITAVDTDLEEGGDGGGGGEDIAGGGGGGGGEVEKCAGVGGGGLQGGGGEEPGLSGEGGGFAGGGGEEDGGG